MPVMVTLTPPEIMLAANAGVMRRVENIKRGYTHKYNAPDGVPAWEWAIEGCIAEYVVSKHLRLFWKGKGVQNTPDLSNGDDVRMSPSHANRLIIHGNDADDRYFWFVTGSGYEYRVHGCILGADAKRPEWWDEPIKGRPAFFVPSTHLIFP
jgi:hypothetical protein